MAMPVTKKNTQCSASCTICHHDNVTDFQPLTFFLPGDFDSSESDNDVDEEHEFVKHLEGVNGGGEGNVACELDDFVPEDIGEDGFIEAWRCVWVDRGSPDASCASVGSVSDTSSKLLTKTPSCHDESED
eukprot:TRINITY_DN11536_c0_g3_i1.p1 TRINITY_DN11536_c0_g3~~TRINITY_DN11536_c0_g3_i1.p1  ORF type:complete len:130 (-),score=26.62 TRINITY_DN11536_c0_g3_i1:44-433(-)